MLILARRPNEVVRVGDTIRIVVCSVRGSSVRIGIEAPAHVPVYREEVYQRVLIEGPRRKLPMPDRNVEQTVDIGSGV